MRYLKILIITIFILFIPANVFASTCNDLRYISMSVGSTDVSYFDKSNNIVSNTYSASTSLIILPSLKNLRYISKYFYMTPPSDNYLYITGFINFYTDGQTDFNTIVNSIPAPQLRNTSSGSLTTFCEYVDGIVNPSIGTSSSTGAIPGSTIQYPFVLRCQNSSSFASNTFNLIWYFSSISMPNSNYTLDSLEFNLSLISVHNSNCIDPQIDELIGAFQSLDLDVSDISDKMDTVNDNLVDVGDKLDSIGDFLSDDSVSTSVLGATNFFNQQDGSYYGLADFVSAIINFMKAIYNDYSCTPLELPALLGTTITLPCFSEWLHDFNEPIYNLWKMVLYFYVGFVICSDLIKFIHDLRDPQNDNLTVMDI